ncbi:hypothetical protein ACJMK2_026914 [Sinanodonta woodiana]|uniref:Uncharacterized protein n=1 Tax=Sinanodonta woodiana TaxID=1069815 RepID=A0ABD3XPM0_SINWO
MLLIDARSKLHSYFKGALITLHPDLCKSAQEQWNNCKQNVVKNLIRVRYARGAEIKNRLMSMWAHAAKLMASLSQALGSTTSKDNKIISETSVNCDDHK